MVKGDKTDCLKIIAEQIDNFCIAWNIKMEAARIILMADLMYDHWKNESIIDIIYAIREASKGMYGTTYNNLTPANLSKFMELHLDRKYDLKERELEGYKKDTEPNDLAIHFASRKKSKLKTEDYNNYKMKYFQKSKKK